MKTNKVFNLIKCWYRSNVLHRVMLYSAITAFFMLVISRFDNSGATQYAAIIAAAVAVGASLCESWQNLQKFKTQIKEVEFRHRVRESEAFGEVTSNCFTQEDLKEIKRKKTSFYLMIGFKVILIIILIAFIVNSKV
jgi:hypothetical protein